MPSIGKIEKTKRFNKTLETLSSVFSFGNDKNIKRTKTKALWGRYARYGGCLIHKNVDGGRATCKDGYFPSLNSKKKSEMPTLYNQRYFT